MRHRNYGKRLSRNTEHRRALLRNLVTSLIQRERIETTVAKATAARPLAEWMITLGKRGDLAARRRAASYLLDPEAVKFLFGELSKRYATRTGGSHGWSTPGGGRVTARTWPSSNWWTTRCSSASPAKRAKKVEARRKAADEAKAKEQTPPPEEEGGDKK